MRPKELDDSDRQPERDGTGYTRGAVTFAPAAGSWGAIRYAAIYSDQPRSWWRRLFSLPWRPWQKYPTPIVVHLSDD